MVFRARLATALAVALSFAVSTPLLAQAPKPEAPAATEFQPVVGQSGKDVIWVPTPDRVVEKMLELAKVGPGDYVSDLGSGDGRIVVTAAKKLGAQGFGVDLHPDMVKLSENRAAKEGVSDRAKFYVRDIFETGLKPASVVTMYLLPSLNLKLRPRILDLKPGTRVVSHAFDMSDWEPEVYDTSTGNSVRLWIVPAKAGGEWSVRTSNPGKAGELDLRQTFQMLGGAGRYGGQVVTVRDAKLLGEQVSFTLLEDANGGIRHEFRGKVTGDAMEGTVRSGAETATFTATRKAPRS